MKKISQYIFGFILFAIVMIMSPIYAQAGQAQDDYNAYSGEGITFKNGEVIVVSAGGKAKTGYKYRSIGWNINVKKDGVDHNIYVADSEGSRYEETVDSTVYTSVHFSESLISEKSGVSLRTGSITMIANARMEAYRASDNKIYSTNNSWTEWCSHTDWANKAIREALERYTDSSKTRQYKDTFYNKVINWSSYYFDVKPGTGVSKTTGSGWYNAWATASYGGTAATGYHGAKSGTKTITGNDSVTVTADPNILTITFNGNGGSNVPSTQTWAYDSYYGLPSTKPVKAGYTWKGWSTKSAWDSNASKWGTGGWYSAQAWASAFGKDLGANNQSVTLYAQWERTITYTFYYFNNQSKTASVTFHNGDAKQTMTIPPEARKSGKSYGGYSDWNFRGFSSGTAWDSGLDIDANTATLTISSSNTNQIYHAQYQRDVIITYIDYGDNRQYTNTQKQTAYLNYNGYSVHSPTFRSRTENAMQYTENGVNGTKKESWSARGWTTKTTPNGSVELNQNTDFSTYQNRTYYGLYQKSVTLKYNANGGTVSPTSNSYTRWANASSVSKATRQTYTMPTPTWTENNVTKYSFGAWTYNAYTPNSDFYGKVVGTNNGYGQFTYTPLVSDTVYAAWTNKTEQTSYEPNVTVTKEAVWNNPSGDNSAVDFDNKQNIDIDGIARVTVKVNITNKNNIGAKDIKVTDYFNTDMWDYYQAGNIRTNVSKGYISQRGDTISWVIPNNTTGTVTLTYYVKIKEPYWSVDNDTNDYINKIPDLDKYLASLTDSSKNPGTASNNNFYYCSSTDASKAYVWVSYKINSGKLVNTSRKIHNATPYVVMRQVNWIPTSHQIGIQSDTNNIYRNIDSSYNNTYFVRYDTKGANSLFKIYERSQLSRSYSYYQITNNLMDMQSVNKTQEVIDNALGISSMRSNTWSNTTSSKLSSGFKALDLLKVSEADNVRGSHTNNGVVYPYGSLTTYDTDYATNQDGLKFSVYPFIRTTNSKQNKTFETTRNTSTLANKRLDLTIDATDPIITADSNIKTKSDTYGQWTEKAGRRSLLL